MISGIQRVSEFQKMVLLISRPHQHLRFRALFNWLNDVPSVFRKIIVSLTKVKFHSCFGQLLSVFVSRFSWYMKNFGMRDLFAISFFYFNNFGPTNQNCPFRLKFGTSTNSGMWNYMVIFSFSDLEQKYSFWANLV